jgi:hypothetical protein
MHKIYSTLNRLYIVNNTTKTLPYTNNFATSDHCAWQKGIFTTVGQFIQYDDQAAGWIPSRDKEIPFLRYSSRTIPGPLQPGI